MRPASLALTALAVLATGCSSTPADPCATRSATVSGLKQCVFKPSCNFSSCHSQHGHQGALDLENDPWGALVGVPPDPVGASARCWTPPAALRRVVPGDPDNSFLIQKVNLMVDKDPVLGARMPNTGQALDAAAIAQLRAWVLAGAPNDLADGGTVAHDLLVAPNDLAGCVPQMM